MKIIIAVWLSLAAIIQAAVWVWPRSMFANVINHIAAYGWCFIICCIAAAVPMAGLVGLFLHVRDFLESKLPK